MTCQGENSAVILESVAPCKLMDAPIGLSPNSWSCRAGFTGGLVIDYPNSSKVKKYYLCLSFERGYKTPEPRVAEQQGGAIAKFDVRPLLTMFSFRVLPEFQFVEHRVALQWSRNVPTISFAMPSALNMSSNSTTENVRC